MFDGNHSPQTVSPRCDTLRCPAGIPTHTSLTEMVLSFVYLWPIAWSFSSFCATMLKLVLFYFTSSNRMQSWDFTELWVFASDEVVLCAVEGFCVSDVVNLCVCCSAVGYTTDWQPSQPDASNTYGSRGSVNHTQSGKAQWTQSAR